MYKYINTAICEYYHMIFHKNLLLPIILQVFKIGKSIQSINYYDFY